MLTRAQANAYRYDGSDQGHYESYFQRANHPIKPLAFWIRYTVFVPRHQRDKAVGELWAVYFDGEHGRVTAVKQVLPLSECTFSAQGLSVRVGSSTLDEQSLDGSAQTSAHTLRWSLRYVSASPPLLLLPERLYDAGFPKAKALVGSPLARFHGELEVDQQRIVIDDWVGSQNHNWGAKHTDRYAWGQVSGFDNAPDAFFECATASIKVGPLYTPPLTPLVLRYEGEEYRLSAIPVALRAKGTYGYFHWQLSSQSKHVRIDAQISAAKQHFVGLSYGNPPGGAKTCLNTKLASCALVLTRKGKPPVTLRTENRAAFEILTDDTAHGVPMLTLP